MFSEFIGLLRGWGSLDTWIVLTGAVAAMSCALPGTWLLLRRQSLLGDALSHSILPGIVLAYLILHSFEKMQWISPESSIRHLVLFFGAAISGVISAILTELVQRWGRLDRGASIGVIYTTMFALGLLMIRMFADQAHVDPSCVLYGSLETSAVVTFHNNIDPVKNPSDLKTLRDAENESFQIPQAVVINGVILLINGLLVIAFFKELRLSTFDPGLAGAVGLSAEWIQLCLMAMTAATLVAAFESVGAILVIAMMIAPAATARLLTDRLPVMLVITLVVAALSALVGHVAALTLPRMLFSRLGYKEVEGAGTSGMMAVAAGVLFLTAIICSPRHGAIRRLWDQLRLRCRIAAEDLMGTLYRRAESVPNDDLSANQLTSATNLADRLIDRVARWRLHRRGLISIAGSNVLLTDKGRDFAQNLVRSHRLWETYMARHFDLPGDHLHAAAEQVEHFLSPELAAELAAELDQPAVDPHGKSIPR